MKTDFQGSIYHSATIWLELKGDAALGDAGKLLAESRRRGDRQSADAWVKIIAAVEELVQRCEGDVFAMSRG